MFNTRWQLPIIGRHSPPLPNRESHFSVTPFVSSLEALFPPSQVRCHSSCLVTSVTAFLPGLGSPCPPSQVRFSSSYLVTSELNGKVNPYQLLIWNRRGNATRPSIHCSQFSSSDCYTLILLIWNRRGNATSQPLARLALVLALPLPCLGHRGTDLLSVFPGRSVGSAVGSSLGWLVNGAGRESTESWVCMLCDQI